MDILIAVILFVFGAVAGSFACCQAWRMHLREKKSKKKLAKSKRSVCLKCEEKLKWYDNIPVFSWIFLKGKCRKCGTKIGATELISELLMGAIFVIFGMKFWLGFNAGWNETETVRYWIGAGIITLMLVGMGILFISDAKWKRLPTDVLTFCIICAIFYALTREWGLFTVSHFWGYLGSLLVLPVLYYLLYKISKERWVGSGDWLVALPIALVLGNFWLGFFCVFLANLIGCIVMVPITKMQKKGMDTQVAFGPFLIIGFMVVYLFANWFLGLVSY